MGIIVFWRFLKPPIVLKIPTKENARYTHIENLEDHNISNNLILDMIISFIC